MPFTFLQLKQQVRAEVWPAGEARSHRPAHDKWFLDALMEIQRYVECFQQNNTDLFPQCSTLFNCGLTSFDFSRAMIKRLSVVNAPPKVLADIAQTSTDVFTATESLPSQSWPGYPNTVNNGINSEFAPVTLPPNVVYDYLTPAILTAYAIDVICSDGASAVPFLLEGSEDNSTWTTVDTQALDFAADEPRHTVTVDVSANATAYRFYRLSIGDLGQSFDDLGMFIYGLTFTSYRASDLVGPIDWCSEVPYDQVDFCHIERYLQHSARAGCCMPFNHFFGLPIGCLNGKGVAPIPTDAGLPPGLPVLPLGYKYPQSSTDAKRRAFRGYWANDRGRIYIAPWIQTTETIVMKWDGIKRSYSDDDPVDSDPQFIRTVKYFVQKEYERDDNRDYNASQAAEMQFNLALQGLWKDCHDETTVRGCEGSKARAASPIVALFYNDDRSYKAVCPTGQTGDSVTVTIPAGTVSSAKSKQDANNLAAAQAQEQAVAQLHCVSAPKVYGNRPVSKTASCSDLITGDPAPPPDGAPVTVNIPANDPRFNSTISEDAATDAAEKEALLEARAGLSCTFWNRFQDYTAKCPTGTTGADKYASRAAHTISSDISQDLADSTALNDAKTEAEGALICDAVSAVFHSTIVGPFTETRQNCSRLTPGGLRCYFDATITVFVTPGKFTSLSNVADANQQAQNAVTVLIQSFFAAVCGGHWPSCGNVNRTYTI